MSRMESWTPTRFKDLGYVKLAADTWRFVCADDGGCVGPLYRTKAELLADAERYAASYGCAEATPQEPINADLLAACKGFVASLGTLPALIPAEVRAARDAAVAAIARAEGVSRE